MYKQTFNKDKLYKEYLNINDIKQVFWKLWDAFEKMFEIANIKIKEEPLFKITDKRDHEWNPIYEAIYLNKYEWTWLQQEEFKEWLYTKLLKSDEFRGDIIVPLAIKNHTTIHKAVNDFIINYWIKLKDEK